MPQQTDNTTGEQHVHRSSYSRPGACGRRRLWRLPCGQIGASPKSECLTASRPVHLRARCTSFVTTTARPEPPPRIAALLFINQGEIAFMRNSPAAAAEGASNLEKPTCRRGQVQRLICYDPLLGRVPTGGRAERLVQRPRAMHLGNQIACRPPASSTSDTILGNGSSPRYPAFVR